MLGNLEVAEREFQSPKIGVIVVIEGESDVQRVAGQKFRLLDALGHAPAQDSVDDRVSRPAIGPLGAEPRQDG